MGPLHNWPFAKPTIAVDRHYSKTKAKVTFTGMWCHLTAGALYSICRLCAEMCVCSDSEGKVFHSEFRSFLPVPPDPPTTILLSKGPFTHTNWNWKLCNKKSLSLVTLDHLQLELNDTAIDCCTYCWRWDPENLFLNTYAINVLLAN